MISANIVQDSINNSGNRLATFVLEFPRWILAELNTHRMFSRNVASSRAVPIEKMIKMVEENPAIPEFWGANRSGMQSLEQLSDEYKDAINYGNDFYTPLQYAKIKWLEARDRAVISAKELLAAGLHKQYVNRTIENFMYVRAIVSATEYENFFALRAHSDAQPELRILAEKMLEEYNKSTPKSLRAGEWHIPFGDSFDTERLHEICPPPSMDYDGCASYNEKLNEVKRKIAVARCARISYLNFEGKDDYEADIKLCDRLFGSIPRHLSPAEHCAQALDKPEFIGNFCGFKQFRKMFTDENLKDPRVKH